MVKSIKSNSRKNCNNKGFSQNRTRPNKVNASTAYDTCTERLSPFGGLLAMIKFLDLIEFKQIFNTAYLAPNRKPKLGHYRMVIGLLMLLFIGFNRLWHFTYIRLDAMMCGFFRLDRLPVASTFWRYVDNMGINQAFSLIRIMNALRERVWKQLRLNYHSIDIDIDTTVKTIYGDQQGGRKGHNSQHRGKKGYRPVLCFIAQTREYLLGKLRKGKTMSGQQIATFIFQIKDSLPGCVQHVLLRADGEFFGRESIKAAWDCGFDFIIANRRGEPPFDPAKWYRTKQYKQAQFNSCIYQPHGWDAPCRFVAMRIVKVRPASNTNQPVQCPLFEDDQYTYRVFCTSLSGKAHVIIGQYDKRADVENLVGEAKREGLDAVPSAKFKNNYAFFQLVMLAYNIWRYMKLMAESVITEKEVHILKGIASNTIRIARLRLLFIAAKVVKDQNRDKIKYSIHDARTPTMFGFLRHLDSMRSKPRPWHHNAGWPQRFALAK
jgi:hypothetical protein